MDVNFLDFSKEKKPWNHSFIDYNLTEVIDLITKIKSLLKFMKSIKFAAYPAMYAKVKNEDNRDIRKCKIGWLE